LWGKIVIRMLKSKKTFPPGLESYSTNEDFGKGGEGFRHWKKKERSKIKRGQGGLEKWGRGRWTGSFRPGNKESCKGKTGKDLY